LVLEVDTAFVGVEKIMLEFISAQVATTREMVDFIHDKKHHY
jgi:hypothetical protein